MTVYKISHPAFGDYLVAPEQDPHAEVSTVLRAIHESYPEVKEVAITYVEMTEEEYYSVPARNDAITMAIRR